MAAEKTTDSIYESDYGAGYITPAQYICEVIVGRKFHWEMKRNAPHHFWKDKKWAKEFSHQSKKANDLLKKYHHTSIVKALRDRRCINVRSLGLLSVLEPVVKEYEGKKVEFVINKEIGKTDQKPITFSPLNKIGKLNDL